MKINPEYLKEFCEYHNIFSEKDQFISQSNINKISYNFGIENFYIALVKNIKQLEKRINKFSEIPAPIDKDINSDLINMLNLKE